MFSKKINLLVILSIVIMAISITLMDFDDLSWETNMKSYLGIFLFLILTFFIYQGRRNKPSRNKPIE